MPWWRVGRERLLNGHWTRCFHSSTSWHHHRIFSFYSLQNWSPKTVEQVSASLRDRLPRLGVVGRIYLAPHPLGGINAQVSVPVSNVDELHRDLTIATRLDSLHLNPSLEDIAEPAFPKLVIKKKKLVADGFDEISCNPITHLKPQEWHQAIQQDDILLYDMRNHYEYEIGRFDKAKKIDSDTFRQGLDMLCHDLRDKKHHDVYMYCTGGIRCSIAGTYLKQRGYNPIMLEGGITAYGHWIKGQRANSLFKGKNFTFDKRRGERITHDVLGQCHTCGKPCDVFTNCANQRCHLLFLQCDTCKAASTHTCSDACKEAVETGKADGWTYDYHRQIRPNRL